MITGNIMLDVLAFLAIGYVGAFLLLPVGQWVSYKRDCGKYGKEQADDIWRRIKVKEEEEE